MSTLFIFWLPQDKYVVCAVTCWARRVRAKTDEDAALQAMGTEWLQEARQHILSDEAANVQRLIGKLHRAGGRAAG